jgi:transcriptional regulator with XRE-family HTH domain
VTFAQRLSELMQSSGMTKYRLSKLAGCSATTVTNWLSGKEITPTYLQRVSEIFNVTTDFLLGSEQKEKPDLSEEEAELNEYLEELKNRPECRMLFKLAKGATKEDVEQAVKIIEALRK